MKHNQNVKRIGFSLVELMISLITISCITAAFTPVITKKLKKQDVALSLAQTSEIKSPCPEFGDDCKLCTKAYCVTCEKSCKNDEYTDSKTCTCKKCSEHDKIKQSALANKCTSCNMDGCSSCSNSGSDEGKYYVIDEKETNTHICNNCGDSSKYYCDGIKRYDKSQCSASESSGYVCVNGIKTSCQSYHFTGCSTCNISECLSCTQGRFIKKVNGKNTCDSWCSNACYKCTNENNCTDCYQYYLLDSTSHKCDVLCSKFIKNCYMCNGNNPGYYGFYGSSGNGATINPNVVCTQCYNGYYLASNKKSCISCSTITNCESCDNDGKCTDCKPGYYPNKNDSSGKTCTACTRTNCAKCDTSGKCLICNQHYHVSNGDCVTDNNNFHCSDDNFMKVGKLCVTRRNMGDSSVLKIPSSVQIVSIDKHEYCYPFNGEKCCWQGETATSCSAGNSSYSGCGRTVCDYYAAEEICKKFNYAGKSWRLPKYGEIDWAYYSNNLGDNGLRLCSAIGGPTCNEPNNCWGAGNGGRCKTYCNRTEDKNTNYLIQNAKTAYWGSDPYQGESVRCVTEMD